MDGIYEGDGVARRRGNEGGGPDASACWDLQVAGSGDIRSWVCVRMMSTMDTLS